MAANKVLIVDELATRRAQIREMLPSGNFEVVEASDGEEAIVLLDSDRVGLRVVIFNFELAIVSGWEVLKKLQTDPELQKIAAIVTSDRTADVTAIVPQPYLNYIEVVETSWDRIPFQKALKSALNKTKLPRQSLPTEPLAPPTPQPVEPEPVLEPVLEPVPPTAEFAPPETKNPPLTTSESIELNPVANATENFVDPFASNSNPAAETEAATTFIDPFAPAENSDPSPLTDAGAAFADPFATATPPDTTVSTLSESFAEPLASVEVPPVTQTTSELQDNFSEPEPAPPATPVHTEAAIARETSGWESNNGAELAEFEIAPTPYASLECYRSLGDRAARNIDCLAISPDGQYLLTGSAVHPIQIWDLATSTLVVQWSLFSKETRCLAVMPDGHTVISGAERTKVKRWDFLTGELLGPLNDAAVGVSAIAISPDGLTLISGALHSNVKLWDLQTGETICPFNDYSFGTTALALTSDGSILVTGHENSNIKLWDFATGDLLGPLNIQSSHVSCLTLSPDNQLAISGHQDGTIEFIHLDSGEILRRIKAHALPVNGIAITPDGQYLISACPDEIKFWGASQ